METPTVDHFPHPVPAPHSDGRRQIFTDYGSLGAVDVGRGDTVAQKSHGSHEQPRLCASQPSLPLLHPHQVNDPYEDVCVGELERRREKTLSALSTLSVIKSLVRKDTKQQHSLKSRLHRLERSSTEGHARDDTNTNHSDDDIGSRGDDDSSSGDDGQSSHYPVLPVLADTLRGQIGCSTDLPKVNSRYTGGCLSCLSTATSGGHEAALLYASGNNLCALPISGAARDSYTSEVDEDKVSKLNLDDRIYEVVTQPVGGEYYCAVRQNRKCGLFQVDMSLSTTRLLQSHDWSDTQDTPSGICLSPYIAGECAVAMDNGSVYLWFADGRCEVVCDSVECRFSVVDNWRSCHYGAHPREVILSDRTGVSLFDVRQSTRTVQMDLFILPHTLLHRSDRVMVSAPHPTNTFLHLAATDHNLVVIDERFPSSPVLHWGHTLVSPPQYFDVISGLASTSSCDMCPGDDVILLSSQSSHETHCFQWTAGTPPQPPHTTATPWRVSQPEDFVHLCRGKGVLGHHALLARLSVSLIGMCALSLPKGEGVTVFQMTAHGDICYQRYQFSDTSVTDVTCAAGPGSDAVSLDTVTRETCTRWQQEAERRTQTETEDTASEWTLRECHTSHYQPGLSTDTYPHVLCPLCMPQWQHTAPGSTNTLTDRGELCHKCGNSLHCGRQFKESIHKGVIPPNTDDTSVEIDPCLSSHDPGRYDDSTSRLLTKLWQEDYDIYHLLQAKEEEPMKTSKSGAVTVVTETPDDAMHTSRDVNSDHIAGSDRSVAVTAAVRGEGSDHPSTSTASVPPVPQYVPREEKVNTRRRYLSTSSVDSVMSMTARGHSNPGFHSTPPRLRLSQLVATHVRPPRESANVHNVNTSSVRASPLHSRVHTLGQFPSPGGAHQTPDPARCRELSFSRDRARVLPPGVTPSSANENMRDAANVVSSRGLTSTGKKKRRKFVIGF